MLMFPVWDHTMRNTVLDFKPHQRMKQGFCFGLDDQKETQFSGGNRLVFASPHTEWIG